MNYFPYRVRIAEEAGSMAQLVPFSIDHRAPTP